MNRLNSLVAATITGGVVLVGQIANAQLVPNVAGQAGQAAQNAAGQAKDAAGQAQGQVRREANQARRETRQQGREAARETREGTREAARETREGTREATRETRGALRGARDTAREATDGARDTAREAVKGARDTARDVRDAAKDGARDTKKAASRESRKFDAKNVKVDDLGLSVKAAEDRGLLVSNIDRNGPLARVGFERNDRIVSVNGERIVRQGDFVRYLFADDIRDDRVEVVVIRDGVEEVVYVEPAVIIREYETVVVSDRDPIRDFGIVLNDQASDRLLVARVIDDSPADKAGVRRDDEIVAVNDRDMDSADDLARMIEKYEDESLDIQVRRERQAKVIKVERVEFVR